MRLGARALLVVSLGYAAAVAADTSVTAPPQRSQSPQQQAREHFTAGVRLCKEARYEEAIKEFEAANRLAEAPAIYYDIAHCWEALNNRAEAVRAFRLYLKKDPNMQAPNPNRAQIEARIAALSEPGGGDANANAIAAIAADLEQLKSTFPQLKEFFAAKHYDRVRRVISYSYKTHPAVGQMGRGGWTSDIPSPDDDGVFVYVDLHDPNSTQQTQPAMCIGDKRVAYLILEGPKTRSMAGAISDLLEKHGARPCR